MTGAVLAACLIHRERHRTREMDVSQPPDTGDDSDSDGSMQHEHESQGQPDGPGKASLARELNLSNKAKAGTKHGPPQMLCHTKPLPILTEENSLPSRWPVSK